MKELRLTFTDAEFRRLKTAKKQKEYQSWHCFILAKCCKGIPRKNDLAPFKND